MNQVLRQASADARRMVCRDLSHDFGRSKTPEKKTRHQGRVFGSQMKLCSRKTNLTPIAPDCQAEITFLLTERLCRIPALSEAV